MPGSGTGESGEPIDAGRYFGDGSFFVDGGAYPDVGASTPPTRDASSGIDATPGCAPLASCCGSLSGSLQSLCVGVASSGNTTNCSAELTQLEGDGQCMGISIVASEIQLPPSRLISDGTTLFWTNYQQSAGLLAAPVGGGPVTTLLTGIVDVVYADDVNVYAIVGSSLVSFGDGDLDTYLMNDASLLRIPKNGAAATRMNSAGASVWAATTLGATAYWIESATTYGEADVKSVGLLGGPSTTVLNLTSNVQQGLSWLGVTSTTAFVSWAGWVSYFPLVGATGPSQGPAASCFSLSSDSDAVYCDVGTGTNIRIASDGTTAQLGSGIVPLPISEPPYIVSDATYVYWVDESAAGTIMKTPKAGGGPATVIAHDTSPTAIAVDAHSVYWADQGGYIKSIPK
jgi:hypothetical protein